ncbi:monooxygenase RutA in pyrimidine catabolism pathway [Klebsiella michiganensis]|nr:monooxygenase RutA in pyrimidine catabolism pathway [Klebsiella michiganensis]
MKIGVFVPIGNNGWLISTHAPQYMPTFELNKAIVQKSRTLRLRFRAVDD